MLMVCEGRYLSAVKHPFARMGIVGYPKAPKVFHILFKHIFHIPSSLTPPVSHLRSGLAAFRINPRRRRRSQRTICFNAYFPV